MIRFLILALLVSEGAFCMGKAWLADVRSLFVGGTIDNDHHILGAVGILCFAAAYLVWNQK